MKGELIRTFRAIDQSEKNSDTVKELSVFLIDNSSISWFKTFEGQDSQIINVAGYETNNETTHELVYILKCEAENKIYGIAAIKLDYSSSNFCSLCEYGVSKVYEGRGIEFYFIKSICENLKIHGFHEIILDEDITNYPVIQLLRSKLGLKISAVTPAESSYNQNKYYIKINFDVNIAISSS